MKILTDLSLETIQKMDQELTQLIIEIQQKTTNLPPEYQEAEEYLILKTLRHIKEHYNEIHGFISRIPRQNI